MSPRAADIENIVMDALEKSGDTSLQDLGLKLLVRWRESDPGADFCKDVICPGINSLRGATKKTAWKTLRAIKEEVADIAGHDALRQEQERRSAENMRQEILAAYRVIEQQGRGIVYFGSARTKPGDPDYEESRKLGFRLAMLLGVTSWSGGGPGAMEGPIVGAKEAGGEIGAVKITLNGEQSSFEQHVASVFSSDEVAHCKYFAPRKVGLVEAGMAERANDRRAFVFLPGGFGTLDELSEVITLKQLGKLGSKADVPILIMNYDGYYDDLLKFMRGRMLQEGKISEQDLTLFTVCTSNNEAVRFLEQRYFPDGNGSDGSQEEEDPQTVKIRA